MQSSKASLRYAKALFLTAKEKGAEDGVLSDMRVLKKLLGSKTDFFNLIKDPTIRHQKKAVLFNKIFEQKINKITMSFLLLLLKKSRESLLLDIVEKYQILYNDDRGIVTAELITSRPISLELKSLIKEKVDGIKNVSLKEKIDKSLLGGFIINKGDLQYDASIRKKINNVKRAFKL